MPTRCGVTNRTEPQSVNAQPAGLLADDGGEQVAARPRSNRHRQLGRASRGRDTHGGILFGAELPAQRPPRHGDGLRGSEPRRQQRTASRERGEDRRAGRVTHAHDDGRARFVGLRSGREHSGHLGIAGPVAVPEAGRKAVDEGGNHAGRRDYHKNIGEHGYESGIIGTVMTVPINTEVDQAATPTISPQALADLLGRWPTADGALYRLLAARIGRLADTGELPAGVRLPPERTLAAALAVSRNTVALAYQVLRDEGMAASRQGSGTRLVPHRITPAAVHRANGFFTGLLSPAPLYDLSLACVDCAPQVAAALHDPASVLEESERVRLTLGSGYLPYGLPELRAAIASMLTAFHGIPTTPEQVLVTTGGQQALDLLLRCEVAPGHPVVTDNPTYPGFIDALYRSGARPVGVPPGDMARLADAVAAHQPALAYLTPTHQNPTGLVLPAAERHEIVALARRHPGVTFIDDMTLAELP